MSLSAGEKFQILFVDDETHILSALKRVVRSCGYTVHLAESAQQGLLVLEKNSVDIVVSDMRMPQMNGDEFLAIVKDRWPHTIRILLTGYSDINSTISAVNTAGIYRYISKPWNDLDLKSQISEAIENQKIRRERDDLLILTKEQNKQLTDMNQTLELKVEKRTEEIKQTLMFVELAQQNLRESHLRTVQLISNLVEMRRGMKAGHAKKVSDFAVLLAEKLDCSAEEIEDIRFAGLIHELGTISLPVNVYTTPSMLLSPSELEEKKKYPLLGESLVMDFEALKGAAIIVRSHCENYDGSGFPDSLCGEQIPKGARILRVANCYYRLRQGRELNDALNKKDSVNFLVKNSGIWFDPKVVEVITDLLKKREQDRIRLNEKIIYSDDLQSGMVISRSITAANGILLLSENQVIDQELIAKIRNFEDIVGGKLKIYISLNRKGYAPATNR